MSNTRNKPSSVANTESSLVQHVRLGRALSRVELARRLQLAPSTIGVYVDRLIAEGFLQEGEKVTGTSGRPPRILELNPAAGQFVGVDFEARQILATSFDFSQQTLAQQRLTFNGSPTADQVVQKIILAIEDVVQPDRTLLGIGIGVPGVIDSTRGIALRYRFIRDWTDIPLVERIANIFRVPVYLENNMRAMALAEQWFGQGRGLDNFLCIGIRSGIAAGLVVDRQLHRGRDHVAGEIGSWMCPQTGHHNSVTLEERASVSTLLRKLNDCWKKRDLSGKSKHLDHLDLTEAARTRDPEAIELLADAAQALGYAVAQMNLLINPQRVIIAGPLGELEEAFLAPLRATVEQWTNPPFSSLPTITSSKLGEYGGAMGSAALAVHQWSPDLVSS